MSGHKRGRLSHRIRICKGSACVVVWYFSALIAILFGSHQEGLTSSDLQSVLEVKLRSKHLITASPLSNESRHSQQLVSRRSLEAAGVLLASVGSIDDNS